ncbi:unnamed protein product [Lota lota]
MSLVFLLGVWGVIRTPPEAAAETRCIKVNSCKCIMNDGTGIINLDGLGDRGAFLRPVPSPPGVQDHDVLLAFSPCLPLVEPWELAGTDCSRVAACLIARHAGSVSRYEDYGRHEDSVFQYNASSSTLSVSYFTHVDRPMTIIHYRCSANRSGPLVLPAEPRTARPLQVWVGGPCACANACGVGDLGLGTIFLIILIISATAYFVLGSCALRAFRTSSGVQIAPEESVWCIMCHLLTERPASRGRQRPSSERHQTL